MITSLLEEEEQILARYKLKNKQEERVCFQSPMEGDNVGMSREGLM